MPCALTTGITFIGRAGHGEIVVAQTCQEDRPAGKASCLTQETSCAKAPEGGGAEASDSRDVAPHA
jgi:hypothetical protein